MKYSTIASALALAAPAFATPLAAFKRDNIDVTVLQFALTLEHLENAFYSHWLRRLMSKDFEAIGFPASYYTNLRYIASDEKSHVKLLSDAITGVGQKPVQECKYTFQDPDFKLTAKDFITLSSILEGVGTSAYLGGAPLITDKSYLTVAGSILVTEALHTSAQRSAAGEIPFANAYGTPLDPNSVYTLAASFIKSCPSAADSTKVLPFKAYPKLTSKATGPVAQESTVSFTTEGVTGGEFYLTFYSGLYAYSVKASSSGNTYSAKLPASSLIKDIGGQVYVLLTNKAAAGDSPADIAGSNVIAGPAILEVTPAPPCFFTQPNGCGVA